MPGPSVAGVATPAGPMRECPRSGNGMDRDCCNKRTSWIDKHGGILKADIRADVVQRATHPTGA